jgi:hypothetical protein
MKSRSMLLALAVVLCAPACSDDSQDQTATDAGITDDAGSMAPADAGNQEVDAGTPVDEPPTITLLEPVPYSGVVTTTTVKVDVTDDKGVAKVELFVGDATEPVSTLTAAPWEMTIDAATIANNGLSSFYVRATDTAGQTAQLEPVPIVIAKGGVKKSYSGTVAIPANYTPGLEIDKKHNWLNNGSQTHIAAVLEWQLPEGQDPWELEFAAGYGECPHMGGTIGNAVTSTTSPIYIEVTEAGPYSSEQRFVHVKPADAPAHIGQSLPYSIRVWVW